MYVCTPVHSISCQFLDIGSHNHLSNEQIGGYPSKLRAYSSKHILLCESFIIKTTGESYTDG